MKLSNTIKDKILGPEKSITIAQITLDEFDNGYISGYGGGWVSVGFYSMGVEIDVTAIKETGDLTNRIYNIQTSKPNRYRYLENLRGQSFDVRMKNSLPSNLIKVIPVQLEQRYLEEYGARISKHTNSDDIALLKVDEVVKDYPGIFYSDAVINRLITICVNGHKIYAYDNQIYTGFQLIEESSAKLIAEEMITVYRR